MDDDEDWVEEIYTLLIDVCSGKNPNELFIVGKIHPQNYPLEMNSILIHVDISKPQPESRILTHAVNDIADDGHISYFNCIIKDNDILYIGDFNGYIKYDNGQIDRITFNNLNPSPSLIESAHLIDHDHIIYGSYDGIVINSENNILTATRVFEERYSGNTVEGIHGIGKSFLLAVGGDGCIAKFEGDTWKNITPPNDARLSGVWCRSRSEIYITGDYLWRWDGAEKWSMLTMEDGSMPKTFDVIEYQGIIYVSASLSGLFCIEGDHIIPVDMGAPAIISRLRITSAGLVGLGTWGYDGRWFVHFDGNKWTTAEIDFSADYVPNS